MDENTPQAEGQDVPSPSGPAPSPETSAASAPATGEQSASPPDASASEDTRSDRERLLDAVREAVAPKEPKNSPQSEGSQAPASKETPNPDTQTEAPADALDADPTEAELGAMIPRTKARFEKLLVQRNEYRRELEALKPAADKWLHFDSYLQKSQLGDQDVNLLLGVGAALKREDWQGFLNGVMPYVNLAQQATGQALPPDLQAKVEAGEIAYETAKELSVTRLTAARLQGQAKATQDAAAASARQQQEAQAAHAVGMAVTEWENAIRSRDPDYAKKASEVKRAAEAIMFAEGRPTTPDAGVALAKRAYDEVNRLFATFRPQPAPTRPVPSGAAAVNNTRPEPKTLMEAAMLALEKSRSRRAA